jgi:hypothetical protein
MYFYWLSVVDIQNIYSTSKHTIIYKVEAWVWAKEQQEIQTTKDDMVIHLPKFRITNSMIPTSLLRKLKVPTKCQLQDESHSTTFPDPLRFASFLSEVKPAFTNILKACHKLGSSRVMHSHLGGFTSKSNKWFTSCLASIKMLKA